MFATAALVDMKVKDDRRKQWDLAIAEAKSSSNDPRAGDPALGGATCKVESSHSILGAHEWGLRRSTAVYKSILRSLSKCQDTSLETHLKNLDPHFRGASGGWELHSAEDGSVPVETEETYLDSASRRRIKLRTREPKNRKQLEHMQQMVLKLVTRLLVSKNPLSTVAKDIHPPGDLELDSKIKADLMKTGRIWQPKYSSSRSKVIEERKSLNESITSILTTEASNPANIESAVAKICYNLLISSAPPSIYTYNLMLIHFTRLQQHHLSQAVVDSFFEDSKFGPTSRTIAAILDHYAAIGDRVGFESVIRRMRGTAGDMRLWTRHLSLLYDDAIVRSRAQKSNVIHRNNLVVAKVPRDTVILNSLILGSLRVIGVRRAVLYFKAALREGCHVTVDLFVSIAQVCLSERNDRAASSLLSAIISRWHQCKGSWGLERFSGSRGIILQLMNLCGIEPLINSNPLLPDDLRKVGIRVFKTWLRAVHLEVIEEHIRRSAKTISGLEILLENSSSMAFTTQQIVLWMLELIDRHPAREPTREPGALVATLQLITDGFSRSYQDIEAQLSDIVYAGVPADTRQKYNAVDRLSPDLDIALRLGIVQKLPQSKLGIDEPNCLIKDQNHQIPNDTGLSKWEQHKWRWRPQVAAVWI